CRLLYDYIRVLHAFPARRSSDLPQEAVTDETARLIEPENRDEAKIAVPDQLTDPHPHVARAAKSLHTSRTLQSSLRPGSLARSRSEEHTSELQSRSDLACRLLLE